MFAVQVEPVIVALPVDPPFDQTTDDTATLSDTVPLIVTAPLALTVL